MRTIVTRTKAYKYAELSKAARERAHEDYKKHLDDIPWGDEIGDSWKALFKAAGVKARDWEIGPWNYSHIDVSFSQEEARDLKGARAFAWLENNLLRDLRAPWGLDKMDGNLHENGDNGKRGAAKRLTWRRYYAPGALKECPLTGVCFDMDFLDALRENIRTGDTLREAFEGLADTARKLLEAEDEYQQSLEAFKDCADANGYEFTREGRRI
jgi:hypothetical protein